MAAKTRSGLQASPQMIEGQALIGAQLHDHLLLFRLVGQRRTPHEHSIARADGLSPATWREMTEKTWVEDDIDGARLVRKEDGDVPASEGCSLAQIVTQHHIQPIVPQRPGDPLRCRRVIIIVPQSPFNRR